MKNILSLYFIQNNFKNEYSKTVVNHPLNTFLTIQSNNYFVRLEIGKYHFDLNLPTISSKNRGKLR